LFFLKMHQKLYGGLAPTEGAYDAPPYPLTVFKGYGPGMEMVIGG